MRKCWHYIHHTKKDVLPEEGVQVLVEIADMKPYIKDKIKGKTIASFGAFIQNSVYHDGVWDIPQGHIVLAWSYFTKPEHGRVMCCAKDFYDSLFEKNELLMKFIAVVFNYDMQKKFHKGKIQELCDKLREANKLYKTWTDRVNGKDES